MEIRAVDETDGPSDFASIEAIHVGDLISTGMRAIGANLGSFVVITALTMSPAMIAAIGFEEWFAARMAAMQAEGAWAFGFAAEAMIGRLGIAFFQFGLQFLAQAVLMYATVEHMAGRRATIVQSLSAGLSRAHVVLALAFLNTVAIGAGLVLCIIPGIIILCVLYVSVPAAIVEKLGPIEAMQHSADLTAGHRLTVFLAWLALFVVTVTMSCTGSLALNASNDPFVPVDAGVRIAGYALEWGVTLIATIAQGTVAAVFYARVRGIRDGIDADEIARVFE